MLCDELYQNAGTLRRWSIGQFPDDDDLPIIYDTIEAVLPIAHRISMTPSFSAFGQVKGCTEYLEKIKPLVKLPYDNLWLEEQAGDPRNGYLLSNDGEFISAIVIWNYRTHPQTKQKITEGLGAVVFAFRFNPMDYYIGENKAGCILLQALTNTALESAEHGERAREQLLMEAFRIMDFLGRINSPNITTSESISMAILNKSRQKKGKPPLMDYHVVDLSAQMKNAFRTSTESNTGKRLHWVRGHFKVCRTGIFWWNPHTAGRKELGVVEKEYVA